MISITPRGNYVITSWLRGTFVRFVQSFARTSGTKLKEGVDWAQQKSSDDAHGQ